MSTIEHNKDLISEAFIYLLSDERVRETAYLRYLRETFLLEDSGNQVEVEYPSDMILSHPEMISIKRFGVSYSDTHHMDTVCGSASMTIRPSSVLVIQLSAGIYDNIIELTSVDITDRMEYIRTRLEVDML